MTISLKPIKPSGDKWIVNVLIFPYCHSSQTLPLCLSSVTKSSLGGSTVRKLSISTLVWGSGRIRDQLAEDCKGKGRSLPFGSQRGGGGCFVFLDATSHGLVYGNSGVFSSLQPMYQQPPRPSLLTGESSQSGQSFTCCNTGGK